MEKTLPLVALVGQPNAGKSSLLNKIAGGSPAVTSHVAGTTRDRQYVDTAWNSRRFTLVDTAGLEGEAHGELERSVNRQIDIALAEADMLVLVADGRAGAAAVDRTVLRRLRQTGKPTVLAVNKLESPKSRQEILSSFQKLGIKQMFGVSALSGAGIGDLLDQIAENLAGLKMPEPAPAPGSIAVAIVGKPNVGKSSVFNALLRQERVVVSALPGTTRTAIDSSIDLEGQNYTFIDTAGLKKKEHRQAQPDVFSGFQTFKAIRRSDVCFLVIDSSAELTKQDQRVAQEIFALDKGCVILANKLDLATGSREQTAERLAAFFPFLWMCPVFHVSANTGSGLAEAIRAVPPIANAREKTVNNQALDEFLHKKLLANPPKLLRDQKKPKVFSLRQTGAKPPRFELLVNHPAAISQQFRKFLQNAIVKDLGFWGTPVVLSLKGKDKS